MTARMSYRSLAARIRDIRSDGVVLVGIDAPGSSGKSTFAGRLADALGDAQVVCMDDLQGGAGDATSTDPNGWGWGRLETDVIQPVLRGERIEYLVYDWDTRSIGSKVRVVEPSGVLILEGLYTTRPELRSYYDFRIWIDCPFDIKRARALSRHARSRTVAEIDSWIVAERAYVDEHRPQAFADLIVSGTQQTATPAETFVVRTGRFRTPSVTP